MYGIHVGSVETGQKEPEKDGEDDHRQHLARSHRGHDIVGHHPQKEFGKGLGGSGEALRKLLGPGKFDVGPRIDDVDEGEADGDREGGRNGVVDHGTNAHPAH